MAKDLWRIEGGGTLDATHRGRRGISSPRFTNEGQIASIPRQVESIEEVLKLTQNLQAMGIDTAQVNENLQKSAVIISSKLNDLLLGSYSVKVNDRDFSVGDAATEKYLTESRRLLLNEGKEN